MILHTHPGPGLPHLELRPAGRASAPVVICLHGYGADKSDLNVELPGGAKGAFDALSRGGVSSHGVEG